MDVMILSKTGIIKGGEPIVVVEPGGKDYYRRKVHALLSTSAPKTPVEWKEEIFVKVLEQELKGGIFKYDVNSLEPMSIIEEENP
jgi:hypothetical protein